MKAKGQTRGTVQMMNTQIDLEGGGEVYQVSGNLSEPMDLSDIRFDGKAMLFQFLEEGDTEPVHWRMELNSPEKASLYWVELPQGLKFRPIRLARDAGNSESIERDSGTRSNSASAAQKAEYVLGDLKIEGDVHDGGAVTGRVLKQLEIRNLTTSKIWSKRWRSAASGPTSKVGATSRSWCRTQHQNPSVRVEGSSGSSSSSRFLKARNTV